MKIMVLAISVLGLALAPGAGCSRERTRLSETTAPFEAACYDCHGDPANGNEAPPPAAWRAEQSADAHQSHLKRDPSWHRAIECDDCHQVPADVFAPGHLDTPEPAELRWGELTSGAGATVPSFDEMTRTCRNYCHGDTLTGGSHQDPSWPSVDGTQAACGTCHGLPPTSLHPSSTQCSECHGMVVGSDGAFVDPRLHVDGRVETVAQLNTCEQCHTGPLDPLTLNGSGADGKHVTHVAQKGSGCTHCHLDYANAATHRNRILDTDDPAAMLVNFAGRDEGGQWVLDVGPRTGKCVVACHGAVTPDWYGTEAPSAQSCPSCHKGKLDPVVTNGSGAAGKHAVHVTVHAIKCEGCHLGYTDRVEHRNGTLDTARTDTRLVYFDAPNLAGSWNEEAASCASLLCHGSASLLWYGTQFWQLGACADCHGSPLGSRRQVLGPGGDFARASHHVIDYRNTSQELVTDADCKVCHDMTRHMSGTLRLRDKDRAEHAIEYRPADPASAEPFCLSCHDEDGATTEAGNALSPFSSTSTLGSGFNQMGTRVKASWNKTHRHGALAATCLGDGFTGCHGNYDPATQTGSINAHGSGNRGLLANRLTLPHGNLADPNEFKLCTDCHANYPGLPASTAEIAGVGEGSNYAQPWWIYNQFPYLLPGFTVTNFRDGYFGNLHLFHLEGAVLPWYYRGGGGLYGNTAPTCVSCHNAHGTDGPHYLWDEWGYSVEYDLDGSCRYSDGDVCTGEFGKLVNANFPITAYPEYCVFNCHLDSHDTGGTWRYRRFPADEAKAIATNGTGSPGVLDNGDVVTIYLSDSSNGYAIDSANINTALPLYHGAESRSWGTSVSAQWSSTDGKSNNILTIQILDAASATLAVGDRISFPVGSITDFYGGRFYGAKILGGGF